MRLYSCDVYLYGSPQHIVTGKRVTVPEIQVLRFAHGQDAVRNIIPLKDKSKEASNHQEIERLRHVYSPQQIAKVFPGDQPVLPANLRDIGIDPRAQAEALRAQAKAAVAAAKTLDETEPESLTDPDEDDMADAAEVVASTKPRTNPRANLLE